MDISYIIWSLNAFKTIRDMIPAGAGGFGGFLCPMNSKKPNKQCINWFDALFFVSTEQTKVVQAQK